MAKRSEIPQHHHHRASHHGLLDGDSVEYQQWRDQRLTLQEQLSDSAPRFVELTSDLHSTADRAALAALCTQVRQHGFGLYQWTDIPLDITTSVSRLNSALSLTEQDNGVVQNESGLSLLKDMADSPRGRFIPYTSRAMGWHTDGYYNDPSATLRSFSLHCINAADSGGALHLMDYELLLIALREEEPDLLRLLSHPQCMTLPANKDNLGHNRPDRQVPVWFSLPDDQPGLRFTTRTQHISWRNTDTQAAADRLAELIDCYSQWHHCVRLESGQGVITRNILHRREAFTDAKKGPPREILRGRYLNIPHTALD